MGCEEVGINDGCVVVGGIHDDVLGWDEVEDLDGFGGDCVGVFWSRVCVIPKNFL